MLAHITVMLAHMKRNAGPHPTESTIVLPGGAGNEMRLIYVYCSFS
jgi:hypothetical protein